MVLPAWSPFTMPETQNVVGTKVFRVTYLGETPSRHLLFIC
jgi:hypothetical protein